MNTTTKHQAVALDIHQAGAAPMIAAMMRKMGLDTMINETVQWDSKRCKISPGVRLMAMVINILLGKQPLYHIQHFYRGYDCGQLFGRGVCAEDFNDDSLGRFLDKLQPMDYQEIFGHLAFMVHQSIYGHRNLGGLHLDMTSITLYGEYEDAEEDELKITYGRSKDNHPDLKQFTVGMVVNSDGLPVLAKVCDGNQAENPWYREMFDKIGALCSAEQLQSIIAVGDAAMVSGENLEQLRATGKQLHFVSRLPGTFKAEKTMREAALKHRDEWEDLGILAVDQEHGARYACYSRNIDINGVTYHAVAYHSSALAKQKEKTFARARIKQRNALLAACEEAMETMYSSEEEAHKAVKKIQDKQGKGLWTLPYALKNCSQGLVFFTPNSKRQTVPASRKSTIRIEFGEPILNAQKALAEQELASLFVLITNPESKLSGAELLQTYKKQNVVEKGFHFLKGPLTLGPIFLKQPHRVEAMAYVFLIAYLVGISLQIRVRRGMRAQNRQKMDLEYRKTEAPTIKVILQAFEYRKTIRQEDGVWNVGEFSDLQLEILDYCGLDTSCWVTFPE